MSVDEQRTNGLYGLSLPIGYGRMQQLPFLGAQPAVTVGFTRTVKGDGWQRMLFASVLLVTDANVANRTVFLDLTDGDGNVMLRIPPAAVQAATLTVRYSWSVDVTPPAAAIAGAQLIRIPPVILMPGESWVWSIDTPQAADRFGALRGRVDLFQTGQFGYPVGVVDAGAQIDV